MDCGWFGLAKQECVEVEQDERVGEHINSGSIYSHCELTIVIEIVDIIDRRRSLCRLSMLHDVLFYQALDVFRKANQNLPTQSTSLFRTTAERVISRVL